MTKCVRIFFYFHGQLELKQNPIANPRDFLVVAQ